MCGIFGTINIPISLETLKPLLFHRGPDAQTSFQLDNVQLHHFRLSILDHTGGFQPMHCNEWVTIFNGELYNHLDVRKKYLLDCKTNSDTETLLVAFQKLGSACLDEFDGMFAFVLFNKVTKQMFLARDRAGKKPLYIYQKGKSVVFSSELNALAKSLPLRPDIVNIDMFFKGSFIGENIAYEDVTELKGGEYAWIDTTNPIVKKTTWWSIFQQYEKHTNLTYQEAEEIVDAQLDAAVKRRIDSSDLEVGAFLSGGIDSGLVVQKAVQHNSKLKTFTVSLPGGYDESELAAVVAKAYNTNHHEITISFDNLKNDFEKIVSNYGEPFFDSSAIPSYYVSAAAKKYVTVILNGDGADELFGGYRRYVTTRYIDFYADKNYSFVNKLTKFLPIAHEKKSSYNYFYRLLTSLASPLNNRYWSLTSDVFQDAPEMYVRYSNKKLDDIFKLYIERVKYFAPLHKQMALDFEIILQGVLLKKMDIATMANSIEGRSPFLCKDFLENIPSYSPSYKIKGVTTKHLLRSLAKKHLPGQIFNQPKRGFEVPLKQWVNNDLKEIMFAYLSKPNKFTEQFIRIEFIDKLLQDNVPYSQEKRAKMLYQLLVTEIWAADNGYV
ncbi:MAG: asparagine synthase (glutamine-hydrolyzing) [Saprospiraceae bacterium]|nr:asparagine synthase (glutamine-hydrolyzing) [Saprospiraceae bacterium]